MLQIPGAGHLLPLEQPDRLADALIGWLARTAEVNEYYVAGRAVPHHVHHAELAERLVVQRDAGRAVVLDIRAPAGRA